MTKTKAFQQAKSEVVLTRYQGQWSVGIQNCQNGSSKFFYRLDNDTALRYRRELVLERTLMYMGYPVSRVFNIDPILYRCLDIDTLDTLIEILEVT